MNTLFDKFESYCRIGLEARKGFSAYITIDTKRINLQLGAGLKLIKGINIKILVPQATIYINLG